MSKLSQFFPSGGQTSTPQLAHLSHLTDHGSAAEDGSSGPSTVSSPSSSYSIDSNNSSHSGDDSFTSEASLPSEETTTPVTQEASPLACSPIQSSIPPLGQVIPDELLTQRNKNREVPYLQTNLIDTVGLLEDEKQMALQLKQDMKVMQRHLSEKDNEIKSLEKTVKSTKLEVSKLEQDLGNKKENLQNEILDRRKTANSLDSMNTELREEKKEPGSNMQPVKWKAGNDECEMPEPAIITSTINPLAVPYTSQDTSHGNLTNTTATQHVVRPKVRTTIQDPIRTTNISTRETTEPADSRLKTSKILRQSAPTLAPKKNVTIIGAWNMRNMSSRLQDKNTNAIAWTNPSCRMQDIENCVSSR